MQVPNSGPVRLPNHQDPYLAELILSCRTRSHERSHNHSQDAVAARLRISTNKYVELERGIIRHTPTMGELLHAVADDLGMTPGERMSLFILSGLPIDPIRWRQQPEDQSVHRRIVHAMDVPAALFDVRSNILDINAAFAEAFPTMRVGANFVRKVLADEETRTELVDWRETWAIPALKILKTRAVESGDDRAIRLFREMEPLVDAHIPVGLHAVAGRVHYKLIGGRKVGLIFQPYRPLSELPSDLLVHLFIPE